MDSQYISQGDKPAIRRHIESQAELARMAAELDRLKEENAQLRASLRAIADAEDSKDACPGAGWRLAHEKFAAFARAALGEAEGH